MIVVEDQYGNKEEKKTKIKVLEKDEEAPGINGIKDLTIRVGDTSFDYLKGITPTDNRDPSPVISVNSKNVNVDVLGDYEITYTVTDRSGNTTKKTCTVSVVENKVLGSPDQSNEKVVYLTFDDGPSVYTQQVLDTLNKYNVKATFFVTGLNPEYFYLIKDAEAQGHTIGMHTYSHNYAELYSSVDAYYNDLNKIAELCNQQIGYIPKYIRFPGGSSNTVSRKYSPGIMGILSEDVLLQGYQYYDWNVSSGDGGGTLPVDDIVAYSTASNANNIVLLCHDANGKQSTVDALPAIIEHYQSQGYRFAGIDDYSFSPHHAVNN
ncbi:MAG: polysaccharide deacetylase family protein [Coprobacillaceae bacterium]